MDRDTLLEKRDKIAKAFEEQNQIKLEAESEQLRLQGEYRTLSRLIDDLQTPEDNSEEKA